MELLNYKINAVIQIMYFSAIDMYNNRFLDSNNSFPFENQIPNDFADDVKNVKWVIFRIKHKITSKSP